MTTLAVEMLWAGDWVRLPGTFRTEDDADWEMAKWRNQFGRPTAQGNPFRVVTLDSVPVVTREGLKWPDENLNPSAR